MQENRTNPRRRFIDFNFEARKEASWAVIALVLAVQLALSLFINLVVFRSDWLDGIERATSGLVQATLMVNVVDFVLIVIGVMFVVGRLRPRDVGLRLKALPVGIAVTIAFWLLIQFVGIAVSLAETGRLALDSLWARRGVPTMLGTILAQLFGNALEEETVFRGFLLAQLFLNLRPNWLRGRYRLRVFIAVLASQAIFALYHVPNRLYQGLAPAAIAFDMLPLLGFGALYALLYLRTENLFIAVGVHSLLNFPLSLFTNQELARTWAPILAVVLLIAWRPLAGQIGKVLVGGDGAHA